MKEAKLNPSQSTMIPPAIGPINDPSDQIELNIPEIKP
jgi:hypothetical protein